MSQSHSDSLQKTINHYRIPLIIIAVGAVLSIGAFILAINVQTNVLETNFLTFARTYATMVDDQLLRFEEKIYGLRNVAESSSDDRRQAQLQYFADSTLSQVPFETIGWLTLNETTALTWQPDIQPRMSMAEIMAIPEVAVGLARPESDLFISQPFNSLHDKSVHYIAIITPVMIGGKMEGNIIGLVRLQHLFSDDSPQEIGKTSIYLFDNEKNSRPIFIAGHRQKQFAPEAETMSELTHRAAFHYTQSLQNTKGNWEIIFIPSTAYLLGAIGVWAWIALLVGLIITGLAGLVTFQQARQSMVVFKKVEEQTEQLKATHKYIEDMMNHIPDPIFMKDREHRWIGGNKAFWEIMNGPPEKFLGKNDKDFFPKEEVDVFWERDDKVMNSDIIDINEEFFTDSRGKRHVFSTKKTAFINEKGEKYLVGAIRDITEIKEAEAEREKLILDLKHSNQELDDFAYIASHDLKEPLRGLYNHASFLIEDYQDKLGEDGVRRLKRLTYLAQRMEHLVSDLLYFSRIGRTELAIQEADPNAIVEDIQQMLEGFIKERNGRIVVPQPMPSVVCDRPRVTEVFRNLITNAIKYNDKPERLVEAGFLEQASSPKGIEKNVFYIKDNGIGIEQEFYDDIFRIFKRLPNSMGEKEPGTGAGLTFVKKIVERHKGNVWLQSELGKGTTFYFTLGNSAIKKVA